MKQIIQPALPGQDQLKLFRDLNGAIVLQLRDLAVTLAPRQAHDVAVVMLKLAGADVHETAKRSDDLGGGALKARLKIV